MSNPKNNNLQPRNGPPQQLSEQTLQQLIENQSKEQALRSQELQIRAQELEYQSKHATAILATQERDREKVREHSRRMQRGPLITTVVVVCAVLIFTGWALHMNKDAVVMDIIKVLLGFAAGGMGGYGYAKSKKKDDDDE
jgi:cation transport ATPase